MKSLSSKKTVELDLIEEYVYWGEKRYRFRIKGTNIVVNVRADSVDEGIEKAIEVLKKIGYFSN
ncbi:MAG: hypothetical protein QXZ60_02205 [Sulfolobales archaeon]